MDRLRVAAHATDPVMHTGLVGYLRSSQGVVVVAGRPRSAVQVAVFAVERVAVPTLELLRGLAAEGSVPTVLVTNRAAEVTASALAACGVVAVLPMSAVLSPRLHETVLAAGREALPGDLRAEVETLHREVLPPDVLNAASLGEREIAVLRLLSEGRDTGEIASQLGCSERTVKNTLFAAAKRLGAHNRVHAVAHALRAGII
ncbi:helix-turn-helix transcriptional regulator [Kutzneria albida]|nr:LuxR C-terminal-related transcriptional regulator [Kutzneria albida]